MWDFSSEYSLFLSKKALFSCFAFWWPPSWLSRSLGGSSRVMPPSTGTCRLRAFALNHLSFSPSVWRLFRVVVICVSGIENKKGILALSLTSFVPTALRTSRQESAEPFALDVLKYFTCEWLISLTVSNGQTLCRVGNGCCCWQSLSSVCLRTWGRAHKYLFGHIMRKFLLRASEWYLDGDVNYLGLSKEF